MFPFCISWKHQKTKVFLMFSGGIKKELWPEMVKFICLGTVFWEFHCTLEKWEIKVNRKMDITVYESELYYCGFKHSNESWYENMGTEIPPIKKKHLKVKSYKPAAGKIMYLWKKCTFRLIFSKYSFRCWLS